MASINKADILKSVDYAKKNQLFNKLNNIYDNLPKGECTGCGSCCMESVGINLIEFLNIYNYLINSKDFNILWNFLFIINLILIFMYKFSIKGQ